MTSDLARRVREVGTHLNMGAVVVVGAGLSLDARFPLTAGLNALVWDALDSAPTARDKVAARLGQTITTGKGLVGDDWARVRIAWEVIEQDPDARLRLQNQFADLDRDRAAQPSPAHEALGRLIHAGAVEAVISLNWDTALEAAYRRLYGVAIPDGVLFKPHGDAAEPTGTWTLPHEDGHVPDRVLDLVVRLRTGHARTLMVIGYSERDRVVVEKLIEPLDASWRAIRLGPHATGIHDIAAPAEIALPLMAEGFAAAEDSSAWHHVTFRGTRDVGSALRGERLDPRDTDTCPDLAEVPILVQALSVDRAVVLNGPTGSGKSISAYQALRQLASHGFEVLRLRDSARSLPVRAWMQDLRLHPQPKVLFIDDAQDLSADKVRELCEEASETTRVLVAGLDHIAGGIRTIRLGAGAAVARLSQWVHDDRTTLFPLVRELDDHVGSHPDDPHFRHRIEIASKQDTAWRFFYVLTGGWRRIRRQAVELRSEARADLALLALAVAQIAGVDAGVTRTVLSTYVGVIDRDPEWLEACLKTLKERRLVIEQDERLRCPHLQTAYTVLNWMLHPPQSVFTPTSRPVIPAITSSSSPSPTTRAPRRAPVSVHPDVTREEKENDRATACALVSHALGDPATSLRGLTWLTGSGVVGDTRLVLEWQGVLGADRDKDLARRALTLDSDDDLAAAATLLSNTISYSRGLEALRSVADHDGRLRAWFQQIAPENAWALGDLVNALYNADASYAQTVISHTDPQRLADLVPMGGWPHSASTGKALERLGSLASQPFRAEVARHMDPGAYSRMLAHPDPAFWRTPALIECVASTSFPLGLQLLREAGERLAQNFVRDPLVNWNDMHSMVMRLGYRPVFLRGGRRPPRESGAALRVFTRALDAEAVARILSRPHELWGMYNFDGFVSFLSECDPKTHRAVLERIDLATFEEALQSTATPSRVALYVAMHLHLLKPPEIEAMLARREPSFDALDPFVAYIAPMVAVTSLKRGLPLDLELDHHHWSFSAEVASRLATVDERVAREVIEANAAGIAVGLAATNHSDPWEGLRDFVAVCDRVAPGLLDRIIGDLPTGAVIGWERALRRPKRYHASRREDIAPLIPRASRSGGHLAREVADLERRFPSLRSSSAHHEK